MKQLKMFLMVFFISLFLFFPHDTFAATLWNWTEGNDIKQTDFLRYGINCHNGSCTDYSKVDSYDYNAKDGWFVSSNTTNIYKEYQFYGIKDLAFSNNNQRDMIIIRTPNDIVKNYSYALSVYTCSNGTNSLRIKDVYVGDNYNSLYSLNGQGTILSSGFYVLPNRPFVNPPEVIWNTCRKMTLSFQTDLPGSYLGFTINNGSTSMSTQNLYFLGYSFNELGYVNYASQEDVTSIQNGVNNVQGSINNVQSDTSDIKQEITSVNDTLTDTTSPDLGGLTNSSTWLPQGPVDSIIMLPLNFINTLVSKIGSTCSPVNLPIPFVDNKYLTLPCISTIFAQIDNFSILYDLIGVIGSVYLLYNYLLKFYKWVDDTLSFRENNWQDWGGD